MVVSITVGFQLFAAKRYCEQLNPGTQVWGYEDIALVAFGPIGKACTHKLYAMLFRVLCGVCTVHVCVCR
jgi:hypothetical protein